jgi:RimJ/RimL family protein N-acetyltransferase
MSEPTATPPPDGPAPRRLPERVVTRRLVVRAWRVEDAEALDEAVARNLDHLRPFMPWIANEPLAVEARRALIQSWFDEWQRGGGVTYGVFHEGEVVGGSGLHRRAGPDVLEIGYWIDGRHVGKGFATELSAALVTAGFDEPGIDTVQIFHDRTNLASGRVPEKLGFRRVGERERAPVAPAETGIDVHWEIGRAEWSARSVGFESS